MPTCDVLDGLRPGTPPTPRAWMVDSTLRDASAAHRWNGSNSSTHVTTIAPNHYSIEVTNVKRRLPADLWLPANPFNHSSNTASNESPREDEVEKCLEAFMQATNWGVMTRKNGTVRKAFSDHPRDYDDREAMPLNQPAAESPRRWTLIDNLVGSEIPDDQLLESLPSVPMPNAEGLLHSIERMAQRLERAEATIRRQEAELANSLLVTSHPSRQQEAADRFEAILESTCQSLDSQAAAIYLLDDATSSLKMRACFGLPHSRLALPARELRGSFADLEALLGNAVLMNDIAQMQDWSSPEVFGSALVVPIGTSTMPHGTIWFWSESKRTFSRTEIEVANLAAGRIMAEIEQSILGQEVNRSRTLQRQIDAAGIKQENMQPDTQVLHEDFDFSGWTLQSGPLGAAFHDWQLIPDELLTFAVGSADQTGPEGALVSTSAMAILRSMWNQGASHKQIMRCINDAHWSWNGDEWGVALALFQINPTTGYGSMFSAGEVNAWILSSRGARSISSESPPLGTHPDAAFVPHRFILQPGEILVACTPNTLCHSSLSMGSEPSIPLQGTLKGVQRKPNSPRSGSSVDNRHSKPLDASRLHQIIRGLSDESARDIAGTIARVFPVNDLESEHPRDRALVLIKNIRKACA